VIWTSRENLLKSRNDQSQEEKNRLKAAQAPAPPQQSPLEPRTYGYRADRGAILVYYLSNGTISQEGRGPGAN
jgi:hypothetical protein